MVLRGVALRRCEHVQAQRRFIRGRVCESNPIDCVRLKPEANARTFASRRDRVIFALG
jgi:hypothetical protein